MSLEKAAAPVFFFARRFAKTCEPRVAGKYYLK
jgi:hypothetical protein